MLLSGSLRSSMMCSGHLHAVSPGLDAEIAIFGKEHMCGGVKLIQSWARRGRAPAGDFHHMADTPASMTNERALLCSSAASLSASASSLSLWTPDHRNICLLPEAALPLQRCHRQHDARVAQPRSTIVCPPIRASMITIGEPNARADGRADGRKLHSCCCSSAVTASVMPAYAQPPKRRWAASDVRIYIPCCGELNCKARTCRLPKVALPLERRHRERDGRVRPAPEAQVGRQRKHTDGRGRARRPQPRVAEGGVVERQEHGEGGEVARVHAHRLARGCPPVQHEWHIQTQACRFQSSSVLEEAKQTAFTSTVQLVDAHLPRCRCRRLWRQDQSVAVLSTFPAPLPPLHVGDPWLHVQGSEQFCL